MFFPELLHPAFGVIRAIAKDTTDTETEDSAVVFLDSDGLVTREALEYKIDLRCLALRCSLKI